MKKQIIDLSGPQGNAYYLLGIMKETFRQFGSPELGTRICNEMMKGDYEHLVKTFDLYLGEHFKLVRYEEII